MCFRRKRRGNRGISRAVGTEQAAYEATKQQGHRYGYMQVYLLLTIIITINVNKRFTEIIITQLNRSVNDRVFVCVSD